MITNFNITIEGVEFEFLSMNRVKLQLFQVYVMEEKKKIRFHMQVNTDGTFDITQKEACPEKYRGLETQFSDAILRYGVQINS